MARKKKGRPISGWLVIDKPAGLTSTACVNKAKWALDAQKAGHSGTLDPAATGVLAIAFGEATKTVPYVTDALKAYRFTVTWGAATNTDDAEGEVIETSEQRPDAAAINAALPAFTGDIKQIPPQFSAVKVNGERAYAKAREGEEMDLAARDLFVESLELVEQPDANTAVLEMICGKGGYVRSIARDLGQTLGCLGHVASLRRIWSGPFDLETVIGFELFDKHAKTGELDQYLMPIQTGLDELPECRISAESVARLRNGNPAEVIATDAEFGEEAWASHQGEPIAVGQYLAGKLHPSRVFVAPEPAAQ